MMSSRQKAGISCLIVLVFILVGGCTTHLNKFDIKGPQPEPADKIPIAITLIMDNDMCQFKVLEKRQGNKRFFHIGQDICENVQNLFSHNFASVEILHSASEADTKKSDATAHMKIIEASVVTRSRIPLVIDSVVVLEWSVTNQNGKILYTNTLKGIGQDVRTFGGIKTRLKASMQRCLNDLMQKFYEDMLVVKRLGLHS